MTEENPYATPEAEVSTPDDGGDELASRWARLGGSLIDGLTLGAVIWPAMYFLGVFERAMDGTQTNEDTVIVAAIGVVWFFGINTYLLAKHGQTIGKRLAKTRIVSAVDNEILPIWKVLLLRYGPFWFASYIPIVGLILAYINPLFIFRKDRRCVHDHIAGTVVVKAA